MGRSVSTKIIIILGIYSSLFLTLVSFFIFSSGTSDEIAIIKMALGLITFWVIIAGVLIYILRDRMREFVLNIKLNWKLKFFLFSILLALIEEAITTTMTNLAPFFGSEIGVAYITATSNYLHLVLFNSVIAFVGMFAIWTLFLSKYDFKPNQVFLIFGLTGSIAEAMISPTSLIAGYWFFVYGLMIYLPAYCVPNDRGDLKKPKILAFIAVVVLSLILGGFLAEIADVVRINLGIVFFTD